MPTRREFLAASALVFPTPLRRQDRQLAKFDELMTGFVATHKLPGAALAVARHGKLVYARGFGYANVERKEPVQPASLFRIASVSKPLTAVAVLRLAEGRKLRLDDPVLDHVKLDPHLEAGAKFDARWKKVTLRQCFHHTGGWDRDKSFDPISIPGQIAEALKTTPPVPPTDVVRYMLGQPLDFDPGERYAYSNLGYLLLGRVIESAAGVGYEEYIRKEVLAPLGVTAARLGRALPEDRPKGEVSYYDAAGRKGVCLYPPRRGERVPSPDGAANFEAFEAHGGWVASAVDLVRFGCAFDDPKRCPVLSEKSIATMWERPPGRAGHDKDGKPTNSYYGCGWSVRPVREDRRNTWHDGLIPGTSALLVRRHDGVAWAVLFNTDKTKDKKDVAGEAEKPVHEAVNAVREWPTDDLFEKYLKG